MVCGKECKGVTCSAKCRKAKSRLKCDKSVTTPKCDLGSVTRCDTPKQAEEVLAKLVSFDGLPLNVTRPTGQPDNRTKNMTAAQLHKAVSIYHGFDWIGSQEYAEPLNLVKRLKLK